MPIGRSARTYMAPREPGGLPWKDDPGRVPRLGSFAPSQRPSPGPASSGIYCFVTYVVEPQRGRPRHVGGREGARAVTARRGSDMVARRRRLFHLSVLAGGAEDIQARRIRRGRCRWGKREMTA